MLSLKPSNGKLLFLNGIDMSNDPFPGDTETPNTSFHDDIAGCKNSASNLFPINGRCGSQLALARKISEGR